MMELLYAALIVVFFGGCIGLPLLKASQEDPELTAGYFEGDMIIEHTRTGIRNAVRRWPNGVVYYKFSDGYFADEHRIQILRGMRIIEAASCIRFQEATEGQQDFVLITGNSGGCYATVGYTKREQNYNLALNELDKGCFRMRTVIHEFLHTLGFFHMQSVWNRDDYVLIKEENIEDGRLHNFQKRSESEVDDFDEEYDYGSVMHYRPNAFSKNGQPTIVALKPEGVVKMGQAVAMSQSDINRLNLMYRCSLEVKTQY